MTGAEVPFAPQPNGHTMDPAMVNAMPENRKKEPGFEGCLGVVAKSCGVTPRLAAGRLPSEPRLLIAASVLDVLHFGSQVQVTSGLRAIFNRKLSVLDVTVNLLAEAFKTKSSWTRMFLPFPLCLAMSA